MGRDSDFGSILRAFRARLTPDAAGVPLVAPTPRRVPGLRRDELAYLAGVSEEHLRRLEQGRRLPSASVVDALAAALRLDRDDHEQLRLAAGFAAPDSRPETGGGPVPQEITPAARRILDRLTEVPTCLCDAAWNVLAGNPRWTAFNCGAGTGQGRDRNMAWRTFTDAPSTVFRSPGHLAGFRAAIAADLRAATRRYPADPGLRDLVRDLRAVSAEFAGRWDAEHRPRPQTDRLTVDDLKLGSFTLDKDVLTVEPGDLRVVLFSAPADSPDADRLATLTG
ncbi:helix-turn-helix transcriptional regulator [Amycolatopsis sp. NBC_00345]|uniref:helix-turn-helix domain-containing protein n=1 Tax=Amycolatopsis sp. NBC_00345 TaxID=2975955 RepID=UPI002E2688AA